MTHGLKPYPSYRASGMPWLGQVPEHWQILRIKAIARLRSGEDITSLNISEHGSYAVYGGNGVRGFTSAYTHDGKFVLIGRQGALCGNINYAKGRFWASEHAVVAHPRRAFDLIWFGELLRTMNLNQYSLSAAQPGLAVERIQNLQLPVPSADEQSGIGRFLSYMDRRVRRYIRAKRKLIALLNEQKQAIIHRAVTRGLDPNVRLKPTGIKWLGDVPNHWVTKPAKYFLREVDERSRTGEEELLSVSHITGVSPRNQKNVTMFMAASYVGHKICRSRDLVVNTMWAWMGALGVAEQTGIVSPSYAVYRPQPSDAFEPKFLDFLLRTKPYISEFICCSTGIRSSRLRLYPERFLQIPLVQPPIEEQQRILAKIGRQIGELDLAFFRAMREIDLIREYRTRLIADVVTGKLDVRNVVLPMDDTDEAEAWDEPEDTEDMPDAEEDAADADQ